MQKLTCAEENKRQETFVNVVAVTCLFLTEGISVKVVISKRVTSIFIRADNFPLRIIKLLMISGSCSNCQE